MVDMKVETLAKGLKEGDSVIVELNKSIVRMEHVEYKDGKYVGREEYFKMKIWQRYHANDFQKMNNGDWFVSVKLSDECVKSTYINMKYFNFYSISGKMR